ncbi:MAG: RNA polymerase sigma factor [Deltaproteobacteria bacterium]|nr:RNA polymerase sigma factor [Deltaproteobacteria bacterium]
MNTPIRGLDVREAYASHARFVWATLHRLGVPRDDLEDLLQEVFIVVHRRRRSWDGVSPLRAWLFGICTRVASTQRRSRARRRESGLDSSEFARHEDTPEHAAQRADKRARARALIAGLSDKHRVVFIMLECEGLEPPRVAEELEIPVGTVYSRLHSARRELRAGLARLRARDEREQRSSDRMETP